MNQSTRNAKHRQPDAPQLSRLLTAWTRAYRRYHATASQPAARPPRPTRKAQRYLRLV